jgi:hypothetical protein
MPTRPHIRRWMIEMFHITPGKDFSNCLIVCIYGQLGQLYIPCELPDVGYCAEAWVSMYLVQLLSMFCDACVWIITGNPEPHNPVVHQYELKRHNLKPSIEEPTPDPTNPKKTPVLTTDGHIPSGKDIDETIPRTLLPVLEIISREFVPHIDGILTKANAAIEKGAMKKGAFPRRIGEISYPMGPSNKPFYREVSCQRP